MQHCTSLLNPPFLERAIKLKNKIAKTINFAILLFKFLLIVTLTACGGGDGEEKKPLIFINKFVQLDYKFNKDYSAYVPNVGTTGIVYTELSQPEKIGNDFPYSFIASMQFSGKIARFNMSGEILWQIDNLYGRFVSNGDAYIFANSGDNGNYISIIGYDGEILSQIQFNRDVNFIHQEGDRLAVVFNEPNVPAQIYEWDKSRLQIGRLLYESKTSFSYARAVKLNGNLLYVADTFNHNVVVENTANKTILYLIEAYYPNDLVLRDGFLYIAEEDLDRILAVNLSTMKKYVSLAPPGSKVWDPYIWNADVDPVSLYGETCILNLDGYEFVRSYASEACSGKLTLYAPNGVDVINQGILVADTDNARIIYIGTNGDISVLTGLNNPTKVFFLK